jgi:hypothetical protein
MGASSVLPISVNGPPSLPAPQRYDVLFSFESQPGRPFYREMDGARDITN